MKPFLTRILICLIPVTVALAVVGLATHNYLQGKGGFKLGVDLVGGTILIYEIDATKFKDGKIPDGTSQRMAEKLKKRLDPADQFGITIRPASENRVEIILPTGGAHQVEAEKRAWEEVLKVAQEEYPVETYVVSAGQAGKETKLLAEVSAQYPEKDTEEIRKFINETSEKEKDWSKVLKAVSQEYKPNGYTAGRGKLGELSVQINLQSEDREAIQKFVEKQKEKVKQLSLTTEGVQEVKEKVSRVGSLEFIIVANPTKDRDGITAADTFIQAAHEKDEQGNWKKKNLHDEFESLAKQGLPPPGLKRSGAKLSALGESYPTSDNFSYSWVELGQAFRKEQGLSDPRDENDDPIDVTDKKLEELLYDKTTKSWKKDDALGEEAKKLKDALEKAGVKDEKVKRNAQHWMSVALARLQGKPSSSGGGLMFSREALNIHATGKEKKKYEYFYLMRDAEEGKPRVTGEFLDSANSQGNEVHFSFRSVGADIFYDFTSRNVGQPMATVLDGYLRSIANIKSAISSQGKIEFGRDASSVEINRTVKNLTAGALPGSLKPDAVSENTMGPTLGQDTIQAGTISVASAFIAVVVFMIFYYRFAGIVACVALFANLLLTVAFMVMVKATFTLPGLAGLVLMLGMAVDANVLIYERLREERERGASLALALRNGYDRAFPTIIDTHLSSIFTAVVLYIVGNDQLKGFGISLTVGLIISLFTSLYMTRLMFDIWQSKGWLKQLSMLRFLSKPNIDFMKIRYQFFTATVVVTIIGAVVFILRMDKGGLNIDFVGGTACSMVLKEPVEIEKLRGFFNASQQTKRLDVEDVKEPVTGEDGKVQCQIKYKGTDKYETVTLTKTYSVEDLTRRARGLDDVSVEQIFVSGQSEGGKSAYFTIRTAEQESDLVRMMLNRLLTDDDGNAMLKQILMDYKLENSTVAILDFKDGQGKADYASRALVATSVSREIASLVISKKRDELQRIEKDEDLGDKERDEKKKAVKSDIARLEATASGLNVRGLGAEQDGRFRWMELQLPYALDPNEDKSKELLTEVLDSTRGAFAARPLPERLENFDSQLAKETQTRALAAIVASWLAIMLYLWFRFGNWTFGLAAVLCLIHDLFFTLGVIAFCHWLHDIPGLGSALGLRDFKIDLQTVAALLTLVGYSVNDTIVVFDRIREVRGKNPDLTPKMINDSINQTLSRTLLTSLTTWLVVIVLYAIGGEGVHLFAFVMVVGVVVGTYSSIYIASPLLLMFGEGRGSRTAPTEPEPEPQEEPDAEPEPA